MKIRRLLERQLELQRASNMFPRDTQLITAAIYAEVGEYLNAIKPLWAWWKRSDKVFEYDESEALFELADVLHFWLLLILARYGYVIDSIPGGLLDRDIDTIGSRFVDVGEALAILNDDPASFAGIDALASVCGFSGNALAMAYMDKTEENLRRWGLA